MKTRVFNLIILDESGSMQSIKKEAIDSVNETIQTIRSAEQENENQEHFISLITFNNNVKTVYDCVPDVEVREFSLKNYHPNCCTAISITNTMFFHTTSEGTKKMTQSVNKSRKKFFARLSKGSFNAAVENECFFDDEE